MMDIGVSGVGGRVAGDVGNGAGRARERVGRCVGRCVGDVVETRGRVGGTESDGLVDDGGRGRLGGTGGSVGRKSEGRARGGASRGNEESRRRAGGRGPALGTVLFCPCCGESFVRRASRQRFCSVRCRRDWDNMRGQAEREIASLERDAEAEEQRWRDAARERVHAGLLPWPDALSSYGGIDPWARHDLDDVSADAILANALLDPLPSLL